MILLAACSPATPSPAPLVAPLPPVAAPVKIMDAACLDAIQAQYEQLGLKNDRTARAKVNEDLMKECRGKLAGAGVHLENYTTAQNVADVNAVKNGLDADMVNLLVLGYGGYLSQ